MEHAVKAGWLTKLAANFICYMKLFIVTLLSLCFQNEVTFARGSFPENNSIKIPDGISVDGIPAIPVKYVDDIKPYILSRLSYLQDLHPLKREILIHTQIGCTI